MNYDSTEIQKVKDLLLQAGFVNDEQVSLGTQAFEFPKKLKDDLREVGVAGRIIDGAYNRPGGSTFYWIAFGSRDNAMKLAKAWAIKHPD